MYFLAALCEDTFFVSNVIAPMLMTGAMTMVLVIALSYAAAQFLRKPEYEAFASIEMHQLLISVLLFVSIFGATCFSASLAEQIAGGDQFDIARGYLAYISGDQVSLKAVKELYSTLVLSQILGSWTMRWGASSWGVIVPNYPSFILVERVVDFLLVLISPFIASLVTQQALLEVIRATMLPFVLPAGVVLRLFPPTRDASSFLLATAIGFGIIFPYTYVMHNAIVRPMVEKASEPDQADKLLQEAGKKDFGNYMEENGVFNWYNRFWSPLRLLSFLLLQALFLPAISITLTVAFIKPFAKFIGQKLG